MKIVQTLIVRDEAEVLDAHIAYHLNAGVDLVIATHHGSRPETSEILDSYERASYLRLFREKGEPRQAEWRTSMARLAATKYEADWVINSDTGEFWWPRGESLKEVLAPIPLRYTIVQGLRRPFVAESRGDDFFSERMTLRRSLQSDSRDRPESPAAFLRPVHRADPNVVVGADGAIGTSPLVPLRAWYPIEVFEFPIHDGEHVDRAVLDGAVVTDTRLRDALRVLRDTAGSESRPGAFALPRQEERVLSFRTPDVVDDAAYAVECAAVGEVDLPRLETYITELEQRVNWLEQRFWPRVLRLASRLVRRVAR